MTRSAAYVICTAPRSGSTLLCHLLAASGVAGRPQSYFHEPSVASWAAELAAPPAPRADDLAFLRAVVAAAVDEGRAGGALFGLRLQRHSVAFLMAQLARLHPGVAGEAARLRAAFGPTLFIHLTRGDKVGQAVSRVKAEQTGLWHQAPDGSEIERLKPPAEPVYDGEAIRRCYEEAVAADRDWPAWFAREGIAPLRLTYEALSADPRAVLARVLAALGQDPALAAGVPVGVRKLADATNRAWAGRFRADYAGRFPELAGD